MKKTPALAASLAVLCAVAWIASPSPSTAKTETTSPIRALMITGGCCHDYENQKTILSAGISERANVVWEIVHEGGDARDHKISLYSKKDWAKGYDVIVHNECFGGITDDAFIAGIAKAHEEAGVGAVVLHCSMHSYREASHDEWRKLLGVSSFNHGKKNPIAVVKLKPRHPVIAAVPDDWVTPDGELYNVVKVWPSATALAHGTTESTPNPQVCVWVNEYGKCRVFGTTIGHHNETMLDPVYLDLVTRGLLWAAGKLDKTGKPAPGYGP